MNGSRERHDATCEMSAKSIVSCTEAAPNIPQPVERQAMMSL